MRAACLSRPRGSVSAVERRRPRGSQRVVVARSAASLGVAGGDDERGQGGGFGEEGGLGAARDADGGGASPASRSELEGQGDEEPVREEVRVHTLEARRQLALRTEPTSRAQARWVRALLRLPEKGRVWEVPWGLRTTFQVGGSSPRAVTERLSPRSPLRNGRRQQRLTFGA